MAKLKLSAVLGDKPVKLTVELPAADHRDLVAYADVLGRDAASGPLLRARPDLFEAALARASFLKPS